MDWEEEVIAGRNEVGKIYFVHVHVCIIVPVCSPRVILSKFNFFLKSRN